MQKKTFRQRWYELVLKAYNPALSTGNSQEKNIRELSSVERLGKSPLEIPGKTMMMILFLSLVICLVFGLTTIKLLEWRARHNIANDPVAAIGTSEKPQKVIYYLLPKEASKFESDNKKMDSVINQTFGQSIDLYSVKKFAQTPMIKESKSNIYYPNSDNSKVEMLSKFIVPDTWFWYSPLSASAIADSLNVKYDFESPSTDFSNQNWKRFILMSAILKIKDQATTAFNYPLRLIQAFAGTIQWLTFWAAIYCLLLLGLRIKWANMQISLIKVIGETENSDDTKNQDSIPWARETDFKNDLFRLDSKYVNYLRRNKMGNSFLAERIVAEVQKMAGNNDEKTIVEIIRSRISNLRDLVDSGEYLVINFLLWLVPSLGFLGTIVGIIGAMEGASSIFGAATSLDQSVALENVAASLGTAFDTTGVALFWVTFMMLFNSILQRKEAFLFAQLEYAAISNLPAQLKNKETNS